MKRVTHRLVPNLHAALCIIACTTIVAAEHHNSTMPYKHDEDVQHRNLGSYFNMRLYWKKGYMWQESPSEKKWCMKCKSGSCQKGSGIKIARCNRDDYRQQFFFDNGRM